MAVPKLEKPQPVTQPPIKVAELCGWSGCYCNSGEVDVGSLGVGCNIKHQTACCTNVPATAAYGECKWVGTASTCNPDCPSGFPTKTVSTTRGAGGEQPCIIGDKSYCCREINT
ncbi:hypothetical protein PG996_004460 [Apiospora saccharicola]|uniref:Uncharacterized protein n=1 Tax=Apiospora saccharicola TaxID=335842 RepID=A0ABR1W716_9PEZI